jgi:hypothetical protein
MSLAKILRQVAAPAATAIAVAFAANANALDLKLGQCLPAADMMSQLKAEGQKSVVLANRIWSDQEKKIGGRYVNVFTSNDSGDLGYQIEGDSVLGEGKQATKFCLVSDYTNIHLYDGRGRLLPSTIPHPSNLATMVRSVMDSRGFKPMLVAQRNGATFVVTGNPDVRDSYNAVMFVGNSDLKQKTASLESFAQTNYSQNVVRDKLPSTDSQTIATHPVR